MSDRIASFEIERLSLLAQVETDEIQQFIVGISGAGDMSLDVPGDHCAVVIAIEDFNGDPTAARTVAFKQGGRTVSEVFPADWVLGADVFYVFPPGVVCAITMAATADAGTTYHARALGYFLPASAYERLSRMATRILS